MIAIALRAKSLRLAAGCAAFLGAVVFLMQEHSPTDKANSWLLASATRDTAKHSIPGVGASWKTHSQPPARAAESRKAAIAAAAKNGLFRQLSTGASDTTITSVTYTNRLGKSAPGGDVSPSVPEQSAWLIVSHNSDPSVLIGGPAALGDDSTASADAVPAGTTCDVYAVYATESAELLDMFRDCDGPVVQ